MSETLTGPAFSVGDRVYLRGCRVGEPGRVIRLERGKTVILWQDLDYIGRLSTASLISADKEQGR